MSNPEKIGFHFNPTVIVYMTADLRVFRIRYSGGGLCRSVFRPGVNSGT